MNNSTCCLTSGLLISTLLFSTPVKAQIIPDRTTNTQVNLEDNTWEITGGETVGKNLFHSFEQFSITQSGTAWFNNAADLNNIFGRVTGSSVSEINGLIRSMGTANLFLINPNGIVFNQGAALDVGGSFLATTADRLLFDDGAEFSAVAPENTSLLTIGSPVGLQLGKNAGAIAVNGRGHNLADGTLNNPFIRQPNLDELRVRSGNNLALVAGEINFNGGVLVAEEGAIDLVSMRDRQIDLNTDLAIADINKIDTGNFGDISLTQKSLLDASGMTGGSITVVGGKINLAQNSHVLIQKFQGEQEQAIDILAAETFSLTNGSALTTENLDSGSTAAINVAANNLVLDEGGNISALAYQNSYGRDIKIDVAQDVRVTGFNPLDLDFPSVVAGVSLSTGKAPNVSLSAQNLSLKDGGNVASAAFNIGSGGDVDIEIENAIAISGTSSIFLPSGISAITGGVGSGGDLSINTGSLTVEDSGIINTATVRGNSGNLTIDAREYVRVSGFNDAASLPSTITSSVEEELAGLPRPDFLLFPEQLSGTSGTISITTPQLSVTEGAIITVTNDGNNDAGNLIVNADSLFLDNRASIVAITEFGNGGNIELQIENDILLKNQSQISTTANQIGQGGNIAIDTTLLTALNNSDITANAGDSFGGQIAIAAQGVFGTEIRDSLTPQSDITATSKLGAEFDGVVEIDLSNANPLEETIELPANFINANQKIVSSCQLDRDNTFVITGKGGIAPTPQRIFTGAKYLTRLAINHKYRTATN